MRKMLHTELISLCDPATYATYAIYRDIWANGNGEPPTNVAQNAQASQQRPAVQMHVQSVTLSRVLSGSEAKCRIKSARFASTRTLV